MNEVLTQLNRGLWTDDGSTTVAQWLQTWLDEIATRRAVKTMANYRGHVRDVWLPKLGHLKLRDLRRHHIERVLLELGQPVEAPLHAGQIGRRVTRRSGTTIEGYRRTIRAALATAQRRGLISANPAEGRMDSIPARTPSELVIWEPEQTARFLESVASDPFAALFEVAAYAGLRRAELCGLRWIDLDGDGAGLTVRQSIVEAASKDIPADQRTCPLCGIEHTSLMIKQPKSRAGTRWVPLVDAARRALDARRRQADEDRKAGGSAYRDHGLVFCQVDGDPLRPSWVTKAFERHVADCGLPPIRLHDVRHGACSTLLAGGVPIEVVQMILGHSSPTVTRQVYAHVMRKATAAQVEAATQLVSVHRVSNP